MRKEGLDEERGEKEGEEIRERRRTEGIVANPSRPSLSLSPGLASRGLAWRAGSGDKGDAGRDRQPGNQTDESAGSGKGKGRM